MKLSLLKYFVFISIYFISCGKNNPEAANCLSETTWIVTRVDLENTNSSLILADTVDFINSSAYLYNQKAYTYRIGNYNSEQNYYLLWEDCVIFGDDVEAQLNTDIIKQGLINGVKFNKVADNTSIYVWMHKIE
jgi:hypothetical protein